MAIDIGPKIGIDGEAQFRKQLQSVNQSLKTLGAEMKSVTSSFDGQERSVEQLTRENEVLQRSQTALRQKLTMQQEALRESIRLYGETDSRTQKWQQAVYETTAALNKNEAQIRQNTEAIRNFDIAEDAAGQNTEKFGGGLSAVAGKAAAAAAAVTAVVAVVKRLGKAVLDAAESAAVYADDINTLAKTTSLSTEELQEFRYASELIDVSLDTYAKSLARLTKNMTTARKGTGDAAVAFETLGISITDASGELRNNNDVFYEVIDALGKIENETERDSLAMSIFGKSAQDLNPLIIEGSAALQNYAQRARELGLVLGPEQLNALNAYNDSLYDFRKRVEAIKLNFIVENIDTLNRLLEIGGDVVEKFASKFERVLTAAMGNTTRSAKETVYWLRQAMGMTSIAFDEAATTAIGQVASGVGASVSSAVSNIVVNVSPKSMTQSETDYLLSQFNASLGGKI